MTHYKAIASCGLLLSTFGLSAQDRPNIILFVVDDMGLMDTSVPFLVDKNGTANRTPLNNWYHTPAMERLAQRGIRFSTFYAQSVSSPSRNCLMTGKNATRHQTTNWIDPYHNNRNQYGPYKWNWKGVSTEKNTLPRLLNDAGYATIHVGKAHLGPFGSEAENPRNIGFDVNIAGSAIGEPGSYYAENAYGLKGGSRSHAVPGLEKYHDTHTFLTEALTIEAKKELDKVVGRKKPFFLQMAQYAVHTPLDTDPRYIQRYQADSTKSEQAKAYATLIEGMDASLGALMSYLEQKGIAEETLIIFVGDNGGDAPLGETRGYAASAPLRGRKGTEFEGGMRVPFIVSWCKPNPRNKLQKRLPIASGAVQTQLAAIMDIFPTILHAAGEALPDTTIIDGVDLTPMLTGTRDPKRDDTFLMHFPHNHRGSYFTVFRKGDYKLIYYYNPEHPEAPQCLLYNLSSDPGETTDIAFEEPYKTVSMVEEMTKRLEREQALYPVSYEGKEIRPQPNYIRTLLMSASGKTKKD